MKLKGQVAIITGGAGGIGRASAILFAGEGARLVIADINPEGAAETADLVNDSGGEAIPVRTDVTVLSDLEKMVAATREKYGRLDILFNNAGIAGPGLLEDTSEADYDLTLAINLKAAVFGCKLAIPEMKRTGGGCILFTSSGLGMRAFPQALAYSLSKAALIQLTRSLAVQLGSDNIRVNALCPGPVDTTDLFQNMPLTGTAEDIAARINTERPVPRFGTTEEMARAALFLISPESAYITGVALPVDGGGVAC